MEENKTGDVAFNLSLLQIQEIFNLLTLANKYFLEYKYIKMVHTLRCVKLSVIQNLTDKEREELAEMERGMKSLIDKDRILRHIKGHRLASEKKTKLIKQCESIGGNIEEKAEEYKITLMDMLEKHNFLIKKLADSKHLF